MLRNLFFFKFNFIFKGATQHSSFKTENYFEVVPPQQIIQYNNIPKFINILKILSSKESIQKFEILKFDSLFMDLISETSSIMLLSYKRSEFALPKATDILLPNRSKTPAAADASIKSTPSTTSTNNVKNQFFGKVLSNSPGNTNASVVMKCELIKMQNDQALDLRISKKRKTYQPIKGQSLYKIILSKEHFRQYENRKNRIRSASASIGSTSDCQPKFTESCKLTTNETKVPSSNINVYSRQENRSHYFFNKEFYCAYHTRTLKNSFAYLCDKTKQTNYNFDDSQIHRVSVIEQNLLPETYDSKSDTVDNDNQFNDIEDAIGNDSSVEYLLDILPISDLYLKELTNLDEYLK